MTDLSVAASIKEAEHPKRDSRPGAYFGVVNRKVAVRLVFDLVESLACAPNLEKVFSTGEEIPFLRILKGIPGSDLIRKESLTNCSNVARASQGLHYITVANVNLVRIDKFLVTFQLSCQQVQHSGSVQSVEYLQTGITRSSQSLTEFAYVRDERNFFGDDHQKLF